MTLEQLELKTEPKLIERTDELLVGTNVPFPKHLLVIPGERVIDFAYKLLNKQSKRMEQHQRIHSDWCANITDHALKDGEISLNDRVTGMVYVHEQAVIRLLTWKIDQTGKKLDSAVKKRSSKSNELTDLLFSLNEQLGNNMTDLKEFLIRNVEHRDIFKTIEDYCGDLSNTEPIKRK